MGSHLILLLPPRLDLRPRGGQALKSLQSEAFVAQLAVEALDDIVFDRLPWRVEVAVDAASGSGITDSSPSKVHLLLADVHLPRALDAHCGSVAPQVP